MAHRGPHEGVYTETITAGLAGSLQADALALSPLALDEVLRVANV